MADMDKSSLHSYTQCINVLNVSVTVLPILNSYSMQWHITVYEVKLMHLKDDTTLNRKDGSMFAHTISTSPLELVCLPKERSNFNLFETTNRNFGEYAQPHHLVFNNLAP